MLTATVVQWVLSALLIISSLGMVTVRKPVHASLSFLVTLLTLGTIYLMLSADFIGIMQVLVYAGAILVLFMFVIILFQDAHQQLSQLEAKSSSILLGTTMSLLIPIIFFLGFHLFSPHQVQNKTLAHFGTAQSLGKALYVDYFFPFEAVILLFLVAVVGALYVGKKEKKER